jgi:hypothetical protein
VLYTSSEMKTWNFLSVISDELFKGIPEVYITFLIFKES